MGALRADQASHITIGAASAQSSGAYAQGQRLGLISDTDCWVLTGADPTAAASTGVFVPASTPIEIYIGADGDKIAAIQDSAAGDLTIAPVVG